MSYGSEEGSNSDEFCQMHKMSFYWNDIRNSIDDFMLNAMFVIILFNKQQHQMRLYSGITIIHCPIELPAVRHRFSVICMNLWQDLVFWQWHKPLFVYVLREKRPTTPFFWNRLYIVLPWILAPLFLFLSYSKWRELKDQHLLLVLMAQEKRLGSDNKLPSPAGYLIYISRMKAIRTPLPLL